MIKVIPLPNTDAQCIRGRHQAHTAHAQRLAKPNRTAVRVDAWIVVRQTQHAQYCQSLRGKYLIQFNHIDRHAELMQQLLPRTRTTFSVWPCSVLSPIKYKEAALELVEHSLTSGFNVDEQSVLLRFVEPLMVTALHAAAD